MFDTDVEQNFWASNPTKTKIRNALTAKCDMSPRNYMLGFPAEQALDVKSSKASGLITDDTYGIFAEKLPYVRTRLRKELKASHANMQYDLYPGDVTEYDYRRWDHPFVMRLKNSGLFDIDYCFLDYCGAMSPAKFSFQRALAKYLSDDVVLSSTLCYSWGTGARGYKALYEEIHALPKSSRHIYTRRNYWSWQALMSLAVWLRSWDRPVALEQIYAYVGGDHSVDGRGCAMLAFRTRFV
jgi:hypothetical protein